MFTIPADYIFQIIWLQNCNLKKLDHYGGRIICPFYCGSVFQESLKDRVSFGIYSDPSLS